MKDKDFLLDLINTPSPVMYESKLQKFWSDYIKNYVDYVKEDNYGNTYGVIKSKIYPTKEPFKVLIDAHIDEISYVVNHIDDNGLIHPIKNGGSDIQLALSKDITILTKNGEVDGVFGWIPIHLKRDGDASIKPEAKNLFIDIGATSKEEVINMGVEIGDPIIYNVKARFLNDKFLVGKSLDDKIGSYINTMVVKKIFENKKQLPYDLYILNSVQEEVGGFGIQIATKNIQPDVAIIFDVFFDSTNPLVSSKKMLGCDAKLGDGAILTNSTCVQKNLLNLFKETASVNNIKYKNAISTGNGGTNADKAFLNNIPTALISIPLKYMHTTVEMINMDDVEEAINLIYNTLLEIDYKQDFRYLKL
jgi:putative aminopeptidase FrvX